MRIETPKLYLPRTGQATSYADGDDGYFQAGSPRATRFVDNGNGAVSDRATGLQWVKQPELIIPGATGVHATNQIQVARGAWATTTAYALADLVTDGGLFYVCAEAHTSGTFATDLAAGKWRQTVWAASATEPITTATMAWADAVANCLALEYAGFDDWRIPNIYELFSLAVWGGAAMFPAVFVNTQVGYYWSGTPYRTQAGFPHYLRYLADSVQVAYNADTYTYYVRPVRGGRING